MNRTAPSLGPHADGTAPGALRSIIRIVTLETAEPILFAAAELERCLRLMSGGTAVHLPQAVYTPVTGSLVIGTAAALGSAAVLPPVADPALDDAIAIQVENRQGMIAGSNPRAVLLAVYRYLGVLGCRWIRPGRDGEIIPTVAAPLARDIAISECPAYRHRGLAIEGACSCEHVTDLLDWMPKVGLNTYFMEYFAGYIFYNNWYSERHRPGNGDKLIPETLANDLAERAIREITRRGMLFHRAGHGWTCLPLGITPDLWDEPLERDFGDMTQYIALFQGKRALYHGIPRRTNLCYSQPRARELVVNTIADYAEAHPEVDYLHVWLADGTNHFCECEACLASRPADQYLSLLNDLDETLTARGISTRIVFLVYADLLWAPERERIRNPERFVLMFAPIHRSFYTPFDPAGLADPVPEFAYNQLTFPRDQNLAHLAAWQEAFSGDSFVFDYRFWTGHYADPGHMAIAKVAAEDPRVMSRLGLNGMVSDQTQRVFFPAGFAMTTLARALWEGDTDEKALAEDYFQAAFGPDGPACRTYLETLSRCFSPDRLGTYVTDTPGEQPPEVLERLEQVAEVVRRFEPTIAANTVGADTPQAVSWRYLQFHARVCVQLAQAMHSQFTRGREAADPLWRDLEAFVVSTEAETHPVFDVFLFLRALRFRFRIPEFTDQADM